MYSKRKVAESNFNGVPGWKVVHGKGNTWRKRSRDANLKINRTGGAVMALSVVTGRDGYIVQKALAYAIAAIGRLPTRQQEAADSDDMRRVFEALCPDASTRELLMREAQAHLRPDVSTQERPQ